jgi:4-diphosphocytidyl-2-C-methyl-D-erythritol kinase
MSAGIVRERAPAKVNLFLEVLGKRRDGYHDIETILWTITLVDLVEVRRTRAGVRMTCDDPSIPCGPASPVVRAARAFLRTGRIRAGVEISILKRIPPGSGLGGASSNVAAVLRALDRLFPVRRSQEDLRSVAARVGSDAPFFVRGGAALCTGRGERVLPLELAFDLPLVVVVPPVPNATANIYRACTVPRRPRSALAILDAFASRDVASIGAAMFNRLQEPALRTPACRQALRIAQDLGPAMVTGSGSAAFAISEEMPARLPPGFRAWRVRTTHGSLAVPARAGENGGR